jgi:hypothetical protein
MPQHVRDDKKMNETYAKKKKNLAAVLLCFKFNQRQV